MAPRPSWPSKPEARRPHRTADPAGCRIRLRTWAAVEQDLAASGQRRRRRSERHYRDGDIAWLLNSRLGGYLVTGKEDDITVYRLSHDAMRIILRERWRDLLKVPDG